MGSNVSNSLTWRDIGFSSGHIVALIPSSGPTATPIACLSKRLAFHALTVGILADYTPRKVGVSSIYELLLLFITFKFDQNQLFRKNSKY